jgi:hypothetical protein
MILEQIYKQALEHGLERILEQMLEQTLERLLEKMVERLLEQMLERNLTIISEKEALSCCMRYSPYPTFLYRYFCLFFSFIDFCYSRFLFHYNLVPVNCHPSIQVIN